MFGLDTILVSETSSSIRMKTATSPETKPSLAVPGPVPPVACVPTMCGPSPPVTEPVPLPPSSASTPWNTLPMGMKSLKSMLPRIETSMPQALASVSVVCSTTAWTST